MGIHRVNVKCVLCLYFWDSVPQLQNWDSKLRFQNAWIMGRANLRVNEISTIREAPYLSFSS